jgi:hypothetical protein
MEQYGFVHSDPVGPISRTHSFPIDGEHSIAAPIPLLLLAGCPPAVLLAITGVVISSVEGKTRWPFSHILQKVIEPPPAIANSNSTSTVARPRRSSFGCASADHALPRTIRRCALAPLFVPMSQAFLSVHDRHLHEVATARSGGSRDQVAKSRFAFFSAYAPAYRSPLQSRVPALEGDYGQPPEGLTNAVACRNMFAVFYSDWNRGWSSGRVDGVHCQASFSGCYPLMTPFSLPHLNPCVNQH